MKNKNLTLCIIVLVICLALFAGCNTNQKNYVPNNFVEQGKSGDGVGTDSILSNDSGRFLIYNYYYTIKVENSQTIADKFKSEAVKLGGYIESTSKWNDGSYELRIRIPTDKIAEFEKVISAEGEIINSSINSEDVTERVQNIDKSLAKLNAQLERFKSFDRSDLTTTADLIALESKISEIEGEIDFLEKQKETVINKVDYTLFSVSLRQNETYQEKSFGERIKDNFIASVKSIGTVFKFLVNLIIVVFPYAIIVGLIILIIVLIRRKQGKGKIQLFKKRKARKVAKQKENGNEILAKNNLSNKDITDSDNENKKNNEN